MEVKRLLIPAFVVLSIPTHRLYFPIFVTSDSKCISCLNADNSPNPGIVTALQDCNGINGTSSSAPTSSASSTSSSTATNNAGNTAATSSSTSTPKHSGAMRYVVNVGILGGVVGFVAQIVGF